MISKTFLFLLCNVYCVHGKEGVKITQPPVKYPCGNQILFGFENSNKVEKVAFQKQIDFLANDVFEKWNNFEYLALLKYDGRQYNKSGSFHSKSELEDYIKGTKQVNTRMSSCDVFYQLTNYFYFKDTHIILFLNDFYLSDIDDTCIEYLKKLNSQGNSFAFVPLSTDFNGIVLTHYFKQTTILEWDINKETPDDWEKKLDDFYDCGDHKTTTLVSTTTKPNNTYPPCSNTFTIAFDKSNGLTNKSYQHEQRFLTDYVFKKWTNFDDLQFYSFDDHVYTNIVKFKDTDELADFINNENQTKNDPDFCYFLYYISDALLHPENHIIIFLSTFNETSFKKPRSKFGDTCQNAINIYPYIQITFVLLNDDLNTDLLRQHIPQAQFIKLNLSNIPKSWEWYFKTAYGCNEDDYSDQTAHPCNNKFIFGFEVSSELDTNVLDAQRKFLINNVFNNDWNVFENLALIAYSNETIIQDFGSLNNLNDIHSFIDDSFKQNASRTSLCSVFRQLTAMYMKDVNIILFVSDFHETIQDECSIWIEQLRYYANFINFVNLTENVDTGYLRSKFPQSIFVSLNTTKNKVPEHWGIDSYGCQHFFVGATKYPCYSNKDGNIVIYDKSKYLSPSEYQKLTNFLLTKVFIQQWSDFDTTYIYNYPDEDYNSDASNWMELEIFIRQNLISNKEPSLCQTLIEIERSGFGFTNIVSNLLFFISKFDENVFVPNKTCNDSVDTINANSKTTFVILGSLVKTSFLLEIFPNATIVEWNITKDEEFPHWNRKLWKAFGCDGESPIILPTTVAPSTIKSTPSLSTTTELVKSTSVSNTPTKTNTATQPPTTVPPHSQTSSKPPDSKYNSKEKILLGIFIPLLIIVMLAFIIIIWWCKRRSRQQLVKNMASNNFNRTNKACGEDREEDQWEIQVEYMQINFLDKLGSGAFGDVYLGKINGPAPIKNIYSDSPHCQRFQNCEVAIKSLPQTQVDEYARSEFWKEIEFMKSLKAHVNLVCFLGYVYDPTNPLMLLEYCGNGDLLHYIKTNKQKFVESFEINSDCRTLVSFAWQISSGLEYLSSLGLIHRDVAARNILLDAQNVCKVSDFGLCRLAEDLTYQSKGGKLPIRWMALESLKDYVYSQKTDAWSYGVLLYELFTLGDLPYVHVENILAFIESGKRLEKPRYCSDQVYELMLSCWQINPEERPTFTELCQLLAKMIETATMHYNYVDTLALIEEANIIEEIDSDSVNI